MRWTPRGRSRNLEDRRAEGGRRRRFPFPMGRLPGGRPRLPAGRTPKLGLGGLLILLVLFFLMPEGFLNVLGQAGPQVGLPGGAGLPPVSARPPASDPREEQLVDFVSFVLDDLQETWAKLLPGYRDAKLVLFRDAIRSGCGYADAQAGPFYCPRDGKVYVDLSFYEELRARFGAPGDFAQAYVLAHEIGHHVQNVTGTEARVRRGQRQDPRQANALSVAMELQADCLAGVWAHHTARRGILEPGDVEEGLRAAAAIGDDQIQKMQTGRVRPEAFTHGSSEQRTRWLRRGIESGDARSCQTFDAPRL
ncbi:MAG: KPN_02809 family neutral zinc metallopeptidase [Myxococcota bacterium]